ncbi:hypothetical protein Dimus_013320 [Dionaea muscipula]
MIINGRGPPSQKRCVGGNRKELETGGGFDEGVPVFVGIERTRTQLPGRIALRMWMLVLQAAVNPKMHKNMTYDEDES